MPAKKIAAEPPLELRDACIVAAQEVIAERGIENLSLRDVARRLGVSHQAPYKHYPSRDHLLAEVMRRCFQRFAAHLDARPRFDDPEQDLASLGMQYLGYAHQHPLEYRLMFSTTWPTSAEQFDWQTMPRMLSTFCETYCGACMAIRPRCARRWSSTRCTSGRQCMVWLAS